MTTQALLSALLRYKASADAELLDALVGLPAEPPLHTALRTLNHIHIVDSIFVANLQKRDHAYDANWTEETSSLPELSAHILKTDRWYIDHIATMDDDALDERIDFTFTDGGRGRMTRAEMLAHVVTHAIYHRGEIGRLLPEIGAVGSRDVFTGYLHRSDPARRN